jgi:hypothetical protein
MVIISALVFHPVILSYLSLGDWHSMLFFSSLSKGTTNLFSPFLYYICFLFFLDLIPIYGLMMEFLRFPSLEVQPGNWV